MSVNSLSSLPWAITYGEEEVNTMINKSNEILDWYDDMKILYQNGIKFKAYLRIIN